MVPCPSSNGHAWFRTRRHQGNVVRMGSTVEYETDTGGRRTVALVFPINADISEGKISILTPIGTALIGLSVGQSIMWTGETVAWIDCW
ncbi:GreA/GreB family elongation factor [Sinorhizobium meliloti]|uniref:GreA/GreB family elongation factor n=1 Tax=Rhizobium meliloti TaxID=382 RepID=UPI002D77490A|nr:GreA/GreB family elongation factor [Sinorhizobium meliloti]